MLGEKERMKEQTAESPSGWEGSARHALISGFNSKPQEAPVCVTSFATCAVILIFLGYFECFFVPWVHGALTRAGEGVAGPPNPRHNEQRLSPVPGNCFGD